MAELDDINAELAQIENQLGQVPGGQPVSAPSDIASIDAELAQIDAEIASRNESVKDLPPEWKDVPLEALKNIPRSTLELGKNVFKAITSPIQTMEALQDVSVGAVQSLVPGEQRAEQTFDATIKFFKDRFGGEENLRRTISEDPAGFLTDLSIFVGGIGSVTKLAGAARAGQVISKVAPLVSPIGATAKGVSAVANKARLAADSIVKTAVKFEKKSGLERIDQLASEFINRGLRLDRKSLVRLDTKIKRVQTDINNIITKKKKEGITVETKKIVDSIDDLIKEADKSGLGGVDFPRNVAQVTR